MLELRHISKKYSIDRNESVDALKDVSVVFPDVQFAAILGPSGCGKTTLLNIIGTLDKATTGDLSYQGVSLSKMNDKQIDTYRNRHIGFVFQNGFMIPTLTVLENVMLSLTLQGVNEKEAKDKSVQVLEEVGLKNQINKRPNKLSGGQQQRAAIARAIVSDPDIILADEPTGALDSKNSIGIMELMKKVSEKRLVIMVTHNEELAQKYADRILRMEDGNIISDSKAEKTSTDEINQESGGMSKLSFAMKAKMAFRNIFNKKWKSILTSVANSFGMIGIAFFLALNHGFDSYATRISEESASSLPVVVTSYSSNTSGEKRSDTNASVLYPSSEEIYPYVDVTSSTSYSYNNFTTKYFNYLDELQKEGIVREYIESYGDDYSFNLMTEFPDSLDGLHEGSVQNVSTSLTSYNYYAYSSGLPYNIFHVLYGDIDQYDLLCGSLPQSENDLVLVVDQYNSVRFNILRALGFYNGNDTQEDVKDKSLTTKVKPIAFSDIIGKRYKVFSNDEYFTLKHEYSIDDALGHERNPKTYYRNTDVSTDFYSDNGIELKITGIIRAKSTSAFAMLGTSLCYSKELQEKLVPEDTKSEFSQSLKNNFRLVDYKGSGTVIQDLTNDLNAVLEDYKNNASDVLPTEKINAVINNYFRFYVPIETYQGNQDASQISVYSSVTSFLTVARRYGAEFVKDDLYGIDLSNEETLQEYLASVYAQFLLSGASDEAYEDAYENILSLIAYMNAYSLVEEVVIFPTNLFNRKVLLERLDSFNEIDTSGSKAHASGEHEVVRYLEENDNAMVSQVGDVISIVSMILIIFAIVSLTVSCAMTALLTSNNVLERRQDIGLLRSLGARKKDIAILFEIESFFIGTLAGLIGSLLTFVVAYPINSMMNYYYPSYHVGTICDFTWYHMLIVVSISILIGLISALIPSLKASKENPVTCLRSD